MLRDTALRAEILAVCDRRGIQPVAELPRLALTRRQFRAEQIVAAIHGRWAGRYDTAEPVPKVAAWIRRHLTDPTAHPTLVISGDTGTGKTHNAVAALKAIATERPELVWTSTTHTDLGDELRPRRDDSHEGALNQYLDAGLVILDDLGAGMITAWTTDCIQRLVDRRWTRRLATIYTTNLGADQLRDAVGDRVVSRLGDATHVNLSGGDRRWTA
jgi:DNA replication protein DnaC